MEIGDTPNSGLSATIVIIASRAGEVNIYFP
jgi:hypothetical protein